MLNDDYTLRDQLKDTLAALALAIFISSVVMWSRYWVH